MGAQELLEFIFRTRKEGNGEQKLQEELAKTKEVAKETGNALGGDLKDGASSAIETFTGLSVTTLSVAGAIGGAAAAAKAAIDGFVENANATRDMATAFGISAEQASAYRAIAGDLRIEQGQLEMAFKTLSAQGIQPSIANLMAISDEYNAIQDPVEKAQYAQDKFGRSALDMARFLELGSSGIKDAAQEAKDYALTLDNKALEANERYRAAMDRLGDTSDSLTNSFGELGANGLSFVVEGVTDGLTSLQQFDIGLFNTIGLISDADAALLSQRTAAGDLTATMRYLTDGIDAVGGSAVDLGTRTLGLTDDLGEAKDAFREMETATRDAKTAQDDLTAATDFAKDTYRDATKALKEHNLTEAQRITLEQTLKMLSGEVTQEDLTRKWAIDEVTTAYMTGKITQSEYITLMQDIATGAGTAADKLNRVRDAIYDIPEYKKVVLDYNIETHGASPNSTQLGAEVDGGTPTPSQSGGTGGSGGSKGGSKSTNTQTDPPPKPGQPQALGGTMFAGGTTIINDSPLTTPELVVVDKEGSGQVLTRQQALEAIRGRDGSGDVVQIFVDARQATDPVAMKRMAKAGVKEALAEAGYRADRIRRTQ